MLQKNWIELIKPQKMKVDLEQNNGLTGIIVAEPLERGYGLTLGNSLRRILLSSLQGAAITSIKVKGAVHEFTTIPGVKEDLTDIVLNLLPSLTRIELLIPAKFLSTFKVLSDNFIVLSFKFIMFKAC